MKTILYMATSVNGYIAKADGTTPWSDDEWKAFSEMVHTCGNIVIGKNTYGVMCQCGEFENIGNPFVVVVSHSDLDNQPENVVRAGSPKHALKILQDKLFDNALVAGGNTLNISFLNDSMVDEVYLDIEPLAFVGGIKLFANLQCDTKLKLLDMRKVGSDTVQLHYRLLK